ncbi:hypothetical protein BWQ95_18495 [Aeromonas hydrophila]|nr:hypothetical protein BWQ95_18495 [Aeromonas hydrophila]
MIINLINIVRLSSHQQIWDEEHVWRGDGKRGWDSEKVERVGRGGMVNGRQQKTRRSGFFQFLQRIVPAGMSRRTGSPA